MVIKIGVKSQILNSLIISKCVNNYVVIDYISIFGCTKSTLELKKIVSFFCSNNVSQPLHGLTILKFW